MKETLGKIPLIVLFFSSLVFQKVRMISLLLSYHLFSGSIVQFV
jgi:hypothetical protein